MEQRNYWLDLFTGKTWQEFLEAGGKVSGFRVGRWKTVQQVKTSDYLLCYLTGVSRFIGVLEVCSKPFKDSTPIWKDEDFPCRVRVKCTAALTPETAVPVLELRDALTIFQDAKSPNQWTGYVRGSPSKWKPSDGKTVVEAVLKAKTDPVVRPVDPVRLSYRPKALKSKVGAVTVPEPAEPSEAEENILPAKEFSVHTEVQWLLAKLGNDMGLDVWVAKNDKNREFGGNRFTSLPRLRSELPLQFDEATNRTVELIDVLWLRKHTILAAFEIESTTSIYSGLLRLSDLISMQPNLNIPLFVVAPDDRRERVIAEVNRPTFSKLAPPMYQLCRFIAFSTLRAKIAHVGDFVRYLKPEILDELAESCEVEEV